jgi:hypothetical protein
VKGWAAGAGRRGLLRCRAGVPRHQTAQPTRRVDQRCSGRAPPRRQAAAPSRTQACPGPAPRTKRAERDPLPRLPNARPKVGPAAANGTAAPPLASWTARDGGGVDIITRHPVTHVTWHGRGDYFASVAPTGATQVRVGRAGWGWGAGEGKAAWPWAGPGPVGAGHGGAGRGGGVGGLGTVRVRVSRRAAWVPLGRRRGCSEHSARVNMPAWCCRCVRLLLRTSRRDAGRSGRGCSCNFSQFVRGGARCAPPRLTTLHTLRPLAALRAARCCHPPLPPPTPVRGVRHRTKRGRFPRRGPHPAPASPASTHPPRARLPPFPPPTP